MPTKSRSKNIPVIRRLLINPGQFAFTQAVRILDRAATFRTRSGGLGKNQNTQIIGKYSPSSKESIRFTGNPSLAFPEASVDQISEQITEQKAGVFKMACNFIGLSGAMGILPYHYSELVIQRSRQRDRSLARFFDLFNHRIVSLFYQASVKYRLPLRYEIERFDRSQQNTLESKLDLHTTAILSVLGLGGSHLTNRQSVHDETLVYYSGLLCQQVKTAAGLKQMLADYFSVPVAINEFVGQWQPLIDDVRTRLPFAGMPLGQNACLGRTSMLGSQGWFAQGKIQVELGPLNHQQHREFAPGSRSFNALNELCRFYLGLERDFELILKVKRSNIKDRVVLNTKEPPIMGWSTWLSGSSKNSEVHDTAIMDIKITSSC